MKMNFEKGEELRSCFGLVTFKMSGSLVGSLYSAHTTTRLPRCSLRLGKPAVLHATTTFLASRDVEAVTSSPASTPVASTASNRTWTLSEPGLYIIYELADKHDYQNQQLTINKGTILAKMIA